MVKTDTLIVGGGLSGLALAERLERVGGDYLLVEARERTGGRILSHHVDREAFDLGPSWFWPGQPRLESLVKRLALSSFEQYSNGDIVFEDHDGKAHRGRGVASMQGSYRIAGGVGQLVAKLAASLPEGRLSLGTKLTKLEQAGRAVEAEVQSETLPGKILAQRVVLAMPPRIVENSIEFSPGLSADARHAMLSIPTWMAGQAKILAVYDSGIWRERGLSGDAMSRHGPMVEIHDASTRRGGPYALFGFVGIPAEARLQHRERMLAMAVDQLERLFGPEMQTPVSLVLQDWAHEPLTATTADKQLTGHHPAYGLPQPLSNVWNGQVLFGSTETAPRYGGFLEGALEASENVFHQLTLMKL